MYKKHTHIHTHIHTTTHTYIHTYIHTHIHTHTQNHTQPHTHVKNTTQVYFYCMYNDNFYFIRRIKLSADLFRVIERVAFIVSQHILVPKAAVECPHQRR